MSILYIFVEAPVEDDAEGDSVQRQRDFEYGKYIRNMVSRWAGSDYESSEEDHAPWHHRGNSCGVLRF